jgi:hypothetical protein
MNSERLNCKELCVAIALVMLLTGVALAQSAGTAALSGTVLTLREPWFLT